MMYALFEARIKGTRCPASAFFADRARDFTGGGAALLLLVCC